MKSDCCLGGGVCQNGLEFDCSMRGLACCLRTEPGSPQTGHNLHAHVLASILDCEHRDRIYSWTGASGTQYVCIVFRVGDEEIIARFPDLAVIGVAVNGKKKHPVCLRRSRDFSTEDNQTLRENGRETGCTEWHIHFAGNFEKFCHDFAQRYPELAHESGKPSIG